MALSEFTEWNPFVVSARSMGIFSKRNQRHSYLNGRSRAKKHRMSLLTWENFELLFTERGKLEFEQNRSRSVEFENLRAANETNRESSWIQARVSFRRSELKNELRNWSSRRGIAVLLDRHRARDF